jgi:hypothetical protein
MNRDRHIGIGIIIIMIPLLIETFYFPVRPRVPLGVAFWPRMLLTILFLVALYLTFKGNVLVEEQEALSRHSLIGLGFGGLYAVLVEHIGFIILTPLFLFAVSYLLMKKRGGSQIIKPIIVALLATIITYLVFNKGLLVQLPEGLLYQG